MIIDTHGVWLLPSHHYLLTPLVEIFYKILQYTNLTNRLLYLALFYWGHCYISTGRLVLQQPELYSEEHCSMIYSAHLANEWI